MSRFNVKHGEIRYAGDVIYRVANRPLIPDELWHHEDLDFVKGSGNIDSDTVDNLPDGLRMLLSKHGYLHQ